MSSLTIAADGRVLFLLKCKETVGLLTQTDMATKG